MPLVRHMTKEEMEEIEKAAVRDQLIVLLQANPGGRFSFHGTCLLTHRSIVADSSQRDPTSSVG